MLFDIDYLKATAERALKTFFQVFGSGLGAAAVGIVNMPWGDALSIALGATILSILTSLGSAKIGPSFGPSLVNETTRPKIVEVVKTVVEKAKPAVRKPAAKKVAPK